jgi:phage I-like protein
MAESDEDKAKMAESDEDKAKMAEDEDEKKNKMGSDYNKMSEAASLLSEVASLRETVATLTAERDASLKKQAVNALLSEGCISPAEEEVAGKAWELRDLQPEFWAFFSERKPSQAVPLNEVGHGASGEEINQQSLNERVTSTAKAEGITYSEALAKVRRENPDFYNQAFGG